MFPSAIGHRVWLSRGILLIILLSCQPNASLSQGARHDLGQIAETRVSTGRVLLLPGSRQRDYLRIPDITVRDREGSGARALGSRRKRHAYGAYHAGSDAAPTCV